MKRTLVTVLVVLLLGGIGMIAIRSLLHQQAPKTSQADPATQTIVNKTNAVSYGGVSFTFDPSLATEVKSRTIPASTDGKPSDVAPEHSSFTLVGYPLFKGSSRGDPEIKVFSIAKFREAMSIASVEGNKGVDPPNPPDWATYFDEEVRVLKALLAAKPTVHLGRFIAKARRAKGCSAAMPFLPMWEACMAFVGHVRYVNFKGGQGVFFLTQWERETTQISNEAMEYAFQGITDDGRYWIYAEFSVAAPFLPKGGEPELVTWNEKNYLLPHNSKKYQDYLQPIVAKLEALPDDRYQPNLKLLEQMIGSLEVRIK